MIVRFDSLSDLTEDFSELYDIVGDKSSLISGSSEMTESPKSQQMTVVKDMWREIASQRPDVYVPLLVRKMMAEDRTTRPSASKLVKMLINPAWFCEQCGTERSTDIDGLFQIHCVQKPDTLYHTDHWKALVSLYYGKLETSKAVKNARASREYASKNGEDNRSLSQKRKLEDSDTIGHVSANEKEFRCSSKECHQNFARLADLRRHYQMIHVGKSKDRGQERKEVEENVSSSQKRKIEDFDGIGHVYANERKFRCSSKECHNTFGRLADLRRHYKATHVNEGTQYYCSQVGCPRSYNYEGGLGRSFGTRKAECKEHIRTIHRDVPEHLRGHVVHLPRNLV